MGAEDKLRTMKLAPLPKEGDILGDKYEIVSLLGHGGMGAVYEARHRVTGKPVAIKWLLSESLTDPTFGERFVREAQAAGRIHHPNVIDIYDVGTHHESPYIVMELLVGESLDARLTRGATDPREVARWGCEAAAALGAAHAAGVIHRDMKPENIFLRSGGMGSEHVKVIDFGISVASDLENARLTRSGAVLGTPYYMPPEQIQGERVADARVDVYALGVILFECLTGRVPFDGDTYGAIAIAIATGEVPDLDALRPGLPAGLAAVIHKAMARKAEDRYPSMAAIAEALAPFTGNAVGSQPGGAHASSAAFPSAPATATDPVPTSGAWPGPPPARPGGPLGMGPKTLAAIALFFVLVVLGVGAVGVMVVGRLLDIREDAPATAPTVATSPPAVPQLAPPRGAPLDVAEAAPEDDLLEVTSSRSAPQTAAETTWDEIPADAPPPTDETAVVPEAPEPAPAARPARSRSRPSRASARTSRMARHAEPAAERSNGLRTGGVSVDDF